MDYWISPAEHDALADLLQKKGDCVAGRGAGDTKKIIEGSVARYALKYEVGDGGYGVVWKATVLEVIAPPQATALKSGDLVAVKILNVMHHTEVMLGLQEIENMQACIHPNILRLHDHCKDLNGDRCLIMEFVGGGTLEDYLDDVRDELSEKDAYGIFTQILDAVRCIHTAGIIHCDLKPSNFMLDSAKNIKVIDFGSSCRKEAGKQSRQKACGSPIYMSPEQMDLKEFDESADLWSMGVILYEILTGELPENVYEAVRHGRELVQPKTKQVRDSAWRLIRGLISCKSKRLCEDRSSLSYQGESVQDLADEWFQDIEYGDDAFCDNDAAQDEGGNSLYEDEEFDSCSSEEEI